MIDTIHILGLDYQIEESAEVEKNNNYGECIPTLQRIRIDPKLADGMKQRTLLHEIIELIDDSLGLDLPHIKITALAATLYQVLVDNPELLADLTKR